MFKKKRKAEPPTRRLTSIMKKKTTVVAGFIFGILLLLIVRLFYVQVICQDFWQQKAVAQQLSDIDVPAMRGEIYDANMTALALSREVYNVIMVPSKIQQPETMTTIADELSVLLDVDRDTLYKQTQEKNRSYRIVKPKIDRTLAEKVLAWVEEHEWENVFYLETAYKREYPLNNLLSTVLGFVSPNGEPQEGLERKYHETLAGIPGRMVVAQNNSGDQLPVAMQYEYAVPAQDGNSLVLTVDQYIQQVAEKYLSEALATYKATNRGCVIVMEADTGAILAMATKNDYDPNNYLAISDPTLAEQIAQLADDEQAAALVDARLKQYRNKSLDFYEPGSVFKIFTAAMGLEEGLVNENTGFYCGNSITVADRNIRCWIHPRGHGQLSFRDALANSCNPSFVKLGGMIGATKFSKYYAGFGFTGRTNADLLGEPAVSSTLYYDPQTMTPVNVAVSSIGQTFKVTPLQMATALCSVANGGKLMQPYIVKQILNSNGEVISNTEPVVKRQVISEDTSARLCAMLGNAVSGGAIKNAYIPGYRIGGKTGTAEKTETRPEDEEEGGDNVQVIASFGGIAPADDPEVIILVQVDEPQTLKSGGGVAAPLAKKILKDILPYMGIEPNYTEEEIAGLDRSVPQVTGNKVSVAATTLGNASLTYKTVGKGDTVVRQIPESGTSVPKGGTVWLYTDESELVMATMPDFTGRTVAQVNQAAKAAGVNVVLSGISTTGGTATASQQSATPGQKVPKGTAVTVEFTYIDNIE